MMNVLAQQGQFQQFALLYCCMLPLGFFGALGLVYFGVRYFSARAEERERQAGIKKIAEQKPDELSRKD